jgi:hypothetical protein
MTEPTGWVSQFHENFARLLNEQLGRRPNIWRDNDLTPNEVFEAKIFNRLAKAAIFLPVLSKIFINRPYCLRELKAFVENVEKNLATYADNDGGEKKGSSSSKSSMLIARTCQANCRVSQELSSSTTGTRRFVRR